MYFCTLNNVCFIVCAVMTVVCVGEPRNKNAQDLDQLLADEQFVNKQIGCVLGRSRCDQFGRNLKASIPRAVGGECKSCTAEEAEAAKKLISFVKQNYPDVWEQVQHKYSRNG